MRRMCLDTYASTASSDYVDLSFKSGIFMSGSHLLSLLTILNLDKQDHRGVVN